MGNLWRDFKYSLRGLKNKPGFAAVVIFTMAMSIGANSALFSVLSAVLFRAMPYADADRLVMVWETNLEKKLPESLFSVPKYTALKEQNRVFDELAAFTFANFNLTGRDEPEQLRGARVSGSLARVLGVKVALGRDFLPEEDQPGANPVVLLSHELWQRKFGSDPSVVGKPVTLDSKIYTVVGVMPQGFSFYNENVRLWVPRAFDSNLLTPEQVKTGAGSLMVVARLKPGVAVEQVAASTAVINQQYQQEYPGNSDADNSIKVVPLREQLVRDIRTTLLVIWGAVALVLLVACANIANLLLARAATRSREVAVRTALGATRWRLVRQLLTESVIMSLLGGTLGLALAHWGVQAILAINPDNLPHFNGIGISPQVFVFTLVLSLLAGIFFGLAPSLQLSKTNLNETLKDSAKGSTAGAARRHGRSLLVVTQISMTLVLTILAALTLQSYRRLQGVSPGFDPHNVLTMRLSLAKSRYPEPQQQESFYRQVLERVGNTPGVVSVGAISYLPLAGGGIQYFYNVEGTERRGLGKDPLVSTYVVSPGYFKAMSIPLLQGRAFTDQDDSKAPKAVIISRSLAARYFKDETPVGRRLAISADYSPAGWMTIVGVAENVKASDLGEEAGDTLYVPYTQVRWPNMYLVVRAPSDPENLTGAVRSQLRAVDPDQPISSIRTMENVVETSVAQSRFTVVLLGAFAGLALVLAVVGVYSMMAYSVNERVYEIGIRMALGAREQDVLRLFLRHGLKLTLIGVLVGIAASAVLTRVIESLLYGVSASDPATFAGITLLIGVVALFACYLPARRASRVDPILALRHK
jgi:putative ABC transport system permease protein